MIEERKKFPEKWPYVNKNGVTIEKEEIDSFLRLIYSSPGHRKKFQNLGLELSYAILWAMERVTVPFAVASLAYAACKRAFSFTPKNDRTWKTALIVKRRNNLRILAKRKGLPRPTNEELYEGEQEMLDEIVRIELGKDHSDDSLREDLKLDKIFYEMKAKPGESLSEIARKPLNRQAEKVQQIRKRFQEKGWI